MDIGIKLESHLQEVMGKMAEVARARMTEAVEHVRVVTVKTLSGHRIGRTYLVPGTKRTYTASSPGEPPAQRLGELRQSVSILVEGTGAELTGKVGTDKKYGPMLEFGTRGGKVISRKDGKPLRFWVDGHWVSKQQVIQGPIAPRPWLRPSFERAEAAIKAIFSRSWF